MKILLVSLPFIEENILGITVLVAVISFAALLVFGVKKLCDPIRSMRRFLKSQGDEPLKNIACNERNPSLLREYAGELYVSRMYATYLAKIKKDFGGVSKSKALIHIQMDELHRSLVGILEDKSYPSSINVEVSELLFKHSKVIPSAPQMWWHLPVLELLQHSRSDDVRKSVLEYYFDGMSHEEHPDMSLDPVKYARVLKFGMDLRQHDISAECLTRFIVWQTCVPNAWTAADIGILESASSCAFSVAGDSPSILYTHLRSLVSKAQSEEVEVQ